MAINSVGGLGVDIVEIERFKKAMEKHPRIIHRLFTDKEKEYCLSRKKPEHHFAVRFATKEAVLKALETGRRGVGWKDVEVNREQNGKPHIRLYNKAQSLSESKGYEKILISLSFSRENAVATAIAIKG